MPHLYKEKAKLIARINAFADAILRRNSDAPASEAIGSKVWRSAAGEFSRNGSGVQQTGDASRICSHTHECVRQSNDG
jgi:hypothetical protein